MADYVPDTTDCEDELLTLAELAAERAADKAASRILAGLDHACACRLEGGEQREMTHLFGMLRDLGDGSTEAGIETLRTAIRATRRFRALSDRIGMAVATALVLALTGGLASAVWLGFKLLVRNGD